MYKNWDLRPQNTFSTIKTCNYYQIPSWCVDSQMEILPMISRERQLFLKTTRR